MVLNAINQANINIHVLLCVYSDIVGYLRESEEVLCNSTGTGEILGQVVLWQYIVSNEESCRQVITDVYIK